jgi:hypothetical protein
MEILFALMPNRRHRHSVIVVNFKKRDISRVEKNGERRPRVWTQPISAHSADFIASFFASNGAIIDATDLEDTCARLLRWTTTYWQKR